MRDSNDRQGVEKSTFSRRKLLGGMAGAAALGAAWPLGAWPRPRT